MSAFVNPRPATGLVRLISYLVNLTALVLVGLLTWLVSRSLLITAVVIAEAVVVLTIARAATGRSPGALATRTVAFAINSDHAPGLVKESVRTTIQGLLQLTIVGPVISAATSRQGQDFADRAVGTAVLTLTGAPVPVSASPRAPVMVPQRKPADPTAPVDAPRYAAPPPPASPAQQAPFVQQVPPTQQAPAALQTPPAQQVPPARQAPPVQQVPPARLAPTRQTPPPQAHEPRVALPERAIAPLADPLGSQSRGAIPIIRPTAPASGSWAPDQVLVPEPENPAAALPRAWATLDSGQRIELSTVMVFGRDPSLDSANERAVAVPDPTRSVSRTHLRLGVDEQGLWLEDANSANGTTIIGPDGRPSLATPGVKVRIASGTEVLIGDRRFTVRQESPRS